MLKDLNQLIDYIEEHLTEGLSYKIIAEKYRESLNIN